MAPMYRSPRGDMALGGATAGILFERAWLAMPLEKFRSALHRTVIGLALFFQFSLAQAVTINPATRNFTMDGGGGAVIVTAGAAESWTAAADSAWINVSPTTSGTGPGTVAYLVSANLSADKRSGKVTIGGQVHTVNQSGYASVINPVSGSYNLAGGNGVIANASQ